MKKTKVSNILGIKFPVIQGPFGGGLSSVELLTTVSNAGGLGSFGAHHLSPDEILNLSKEIKTKTDKPFALNLWVKDQDNDGLRISKDQFEKTYKILRPYFEELKIPKPDYPEIFGQEFEKQIEAIFQARPPVFSFVYGIPDPAILKECRNREIVTIGTAITPDEAIALDEAGVDLIVATGFEAGGHRVSFLKEPEDSLYGTLALIPMVTDLVKAPVIAAGGIVDSRGVNAAFALGAEAVQVGTAFLATKESNAGNLHRAQLFTKNSRYTNLSRAFSGRLARGIENKFMKEMEAHKHELAPYPAQSWFTAKIKKAALEQGREDLMSLWCGQGAGLLKFQNANDVLQSLVEGL